MVKVPCLKCNQPIDLVSNQKIGQQIVCHSCQTILEVVWLFPVCLDYTETTNLNSTYMKENYTKVSGAQKVTPTKNLD